MSISEGLSHSRRLLFRTGLLAAVALTGIVWVTSQGGTPTADFALSEIELGSMQGAYHF